MATPAGPRVAEFAAKQFKAKRGRSDDRPVVKHRAGELPQAVDQVLAIFAGMGEHARVYVWAGRLCRLHQLPEATTARVQRPQGAVLVLPCDSVHLAELATRVAQHLKFDARSGEDVPTDCPRRVADALLSRSSWPELPELAGIIESALLLPDGRVLDRPGYDQASGLYLTAVPDDYTAPPHAPTSDDADTAAEEIIEALAEFAFATPGDRSAAIAAVMTGVLRRPLPAAPLIAVSAPTPGTGKSLLGDLVSVVACGRTAPVIAVEGDETELSKRLGGALLAGDPLLMLDNIDMPLRGAFLCQVATQGHVRIRPLGGSTMVTVPTSATVVLTGNNLALRGDLTRRVLPINLDAGLERPEQRTFRRDAVQYVRENRGRLIRAVLTLSLAYRAAGEPAVSAPAFGGFGEWDRLVRRPLVWLGHPDPLAGVELLREADPGQEAARALLSAWHQLFQGEPVTVSQVIEASRKLLPPSFADGARDPEHPDLYEAMHAVLGERIEAKRFGYWLRSHQGRIFDGLRVVRGPKEGHRKVARWRVVPAGNAGYAGSVSHHPLKMSAS